MLLTTVYDTMKKYEHFGTIQTEKKTGRPPIMTTRDRRELDCIITRGRRLTVAQVTDLLTHQVSTRTIKCKIHKLGKKSHIAPKETLPPIMPCLSPCPPPLDEQQLGPGDLDGQVRIQAWEKGKLGPCLEDTSREVATGKPCGQPLIRLTDAHGMGCFLHSNASTIGLSQQLNDIGQDGAASLSTRPAPVHSLDGAGSLDTWSPMHLTDGG
ncbi:hypothetical protein O181_028916 [Austropuccinia psidii MF-1]|uniref:Transposase Tc1-like domain-containing protein n=1 Tax=Austropuccinia psidii MF-1 TaxID=1389203 RepID=A0A9Q3CVH1_9BASI|nr:hypothetical protein [Austropuccinia psidii MF-1]